jgi:serine phosphatase RsbU (regulator of sigma subunit)
MDQLEVVDGQGHRRRVDLKHPRLLIGREPSCDLHLPHPGVSRRHAQLQRTEQGRWLLQDLNSRNHVFVDNKPVQQVVLEPRKPFRIADYWLMLHDTAPADGEHGLDDTSDTGTGPEAGWLEQLHAFHRALARLEDPPQVLERLAREFRRICQPQLLAIGLARPKGYTWEVVLGEDSGSGIQPSLDDASNHLLEEDSSAILSWTTSPPEIETPTPSPPACLLFPMKGRAGRIGHVYVRRPSLTPLPRLVQRYLALSASVAGLVWDNLQLGSLRLTQIEFEKELHQARQIQIDLFPPTFEVDDRLDAFAVNLPSARVSGDYYDLIRTGPDTVAFVIADAMGHGMPAAILMAAVRAALRMGLALRLPWSAVFQGLDEIIRQARGDTFVTGLVGQLDLHRRELTVVCAGHPLPSILVDGKPVELPQACHTRPWGLDLETAWGVGTVALGEGSWSILCYTDGVTDAAVRVQRLYGARRVAAYHREHHHLNAEDLCQGLLSEVAYQPGMASLGDDQTVLVLRSA